MLVFLLIELELTRNSGPYDVKSIVRIIYITAQNMCPSLTFWVQLTILAILRIWYHLKQLCLKISVSKTEYKYSYYLCQYHHIEMHT